MPRSECPTCPIENNSALVQLAERVERVYVSDALATAGFDAEDAIHEGIITPDDIDRLTPKIHEDAGLSLGCFPVLRETAQQDQETLNGLVDETKVALAGCATCRLQRTCCLEGFAPKGKKME